MTTANAATAGSRQGEPKQVEWTQTGVGVNITQDDGSILLVASIENSIDGPGATVSEITLGGNTGTSSATRYTAKGVLKGEEEFTLGAPDADGMIPLNGSGKCAKGGKRAYRGVKCTYSFAGTLDPVTNIVTFEIAGTTSR